MIRTLFFDFGNVLAFFDHMRAVQRFEAFTSLRGQDIYDRLYDCPLEDAYERGTVSTPDYIAAATESAGMVIGDDAFRSAFVDIFTPNPDVLDAIPELATRYRICLASNTNDMHFRHYTDRFSDVFKCFAALPTSHQCGHRKPEGGYYEYCQTFAQCEPHEVLFIDDMPGNIVAAKAFGWNAVQYRLGDRVRELIAGA